MTFPEPTAPATSRADVFMSYLDFFRDVLIAKVSEMPADDRVRSRLPSGWTPVELLVHLTFVERRWLEWGFEDPDLPDPWGDQHDGRWRVPGDRSFEEVVASLRERGAVTRRIVASHDLDDVGRPGDRWEGRPPASLERVLFHLLQEYARHAGHLDVVAELVTGRTGE